MPTDPIASARSTAPIATSLVAIAMTPPMNSATPTGSVMAPARTRPFTFGSGIFEPLISATSALGARSAESGYYAER